MAGRGSATDRVGVWSHSPRRAWASNAARARRWRRLRLDAAAGVLLFDIRWNQNQHDRDVDQGSYDWQVEWQPAVTPQLFDLIPPLHWRTSIPGGPTASSRFSGASARDEPTLIRRRGRRALLARCHRKDRPNNLPARIHAAFPRPCSEALAERLAETVHSGPDS